MHKGRVKLALGAGGTGSLLPVAATAAGRLPGTDLYRTASSGTPSKWRRGAVSPARRAIQLAATALLLFVGYQTLRGAPDGSRAAVQPLTTQQQQAAEEGGGVGLPQDLQAEQREQGQLAAQAATAAAAAQQQQPGERQREPEQQRQQEPPARPQVAISEADRAAYAAAQAAQPAIRAALEEHRQVQQRRSAAYAGPLPGPPPKVALMFLVRGHVPMEPLWREFFEAAAQIEPTALPPPFAGGAAARRRLAEEQQQQGEQQGGEGSALDQGSDEKGPQLTPFQQQQRAANKQLAAALGAGGVVLQAQADARSATTMEAPASMLSPVDPAGPIARQDLFSVYAHTLPGFYYPNTSIFSGYQIDRRVYVRWGQYTVAEAERRLIWAALRDPLNQRFLLVSETCTPLYPPHVFYLELLSDTRSRLNACALPGGGTAERWHSALYLPGVLGPPQWRKSSQWKALVRSHAALVAADRQLAPRFERECYSYLPPRIPRPPYVQAQNRTWVPRTCVSDEHYIPTLLAVHGQDAQTTCRDSLTAADWVPDTWSPVVHSGAEVTPELLRRLRKEQWSEVDCPAAAAVASAAGMFRRRGAAVTLAGTPLAQQQQQGEGGGYQALSERCYLLARKFTPDAVPALLQLAGDCADGTGLGDSCLAGRAQA